MFKQAGFTLVELMVVIVIVSLLAAIGLPSYQQYTQRAAMTDLLQGMLGYKSAVELCALDLGNHASQLVSTQCSQGKNGIPDAYKSPDKHHGYTQAITVDAHGVITLAGQRSLQGLTVTLVPSITPLGTIQWLKQCQSNSASLNHSCQSTFKFPDLTTSMTATTTPTDTINAK